MSNPTDRTALREKDDLGLSIDMLDVDRLRQAASQCVFEVQPEVRPGIVGEWLSNLADRVEQAVRDIGVLRQAAPPEGRRCEWCAGLKRDFEGPCSACNGTGITPSSPPLPVQGTEHCCANCHHRWTATALPAEVCGDCWRKFREAEALIRQYQAARDGWRGTRGEHGGARQDAGDALQTAEDALDKWQR
jgi:hypothetical protein